MKAEAVNAPSPIAAMAGEQVVLFDGVCNLCNGFVQFIIERDPKARFRFGALQSVEAQHLLRDSTVRPEDLSTVIYLRKGRVLTRSTAALYVLKDLGGSWSLCFVFIIVPPFIRNAVYGWVARNRYKWFGQRESCMLPTPELRARFLDGLRG
jgi:predicted DCC family thiol-disulfide oxidoreductase YuxK